jgi:hypothetical protein
MPTADLSALMRKMLVQALPSPLVDTKKNWGHTKEGVSGVKWKSHGLTLRPELMRSQRNDGVWRKLQVVAEKPEETLVFELRDFQTPEPGRSTFVVFVALDVKAFYDQQNWDDGRRLFSAGVNAAMRMKATLHCELTSRVEKPGLLPDLILSVKVTKAEVGYDHLKVEHVAGIGGDAARLLGETMKGAIDVFKPSLEEHLMEKGNAAIIKALDAKEVRVSLSNILSGQKPTIKPIKK